MKKVSKTILDWYKQTGKDFPWRQTRDPYKILVSEIMLQQTQVDRVVEKYQEFIKRFPTAEKLARARSASVITAWKGLGYNRRALYLQKTAQAVIKEHGGIFPRDIETLKTLPGVGDYTARAILAFAFEESVPMMDTNHRRFYQRVFFGLVEKSDGELLDVGEEVIRDIERDFSPAARNDNVGAYDWNQALMDFGQRICLTRKPKCDECPIQKYCKAYPDILSIKPKVKKKKKAIRFRDTDRYYRGRIVDYLREQKKGSTEALRRICADIEQERFIKIIGKLEQDGLITKRGKQYQL